MTLQRVLAGVYVVALACIGMWPTPVDAELGVVESWPVQRFASLTGMQPWEAYGFVEFGANVLLFVPLGWFAVVLLGLRWWQAALLGVGLSAVVEVGQAVLRPNRFATLQDVVANSSGALLGAVLAVLVLGVLARSRGSRSRSS